MPVDFVSRHAYTSGPAQHVPFGVYQTMAPASRLLEQFALPRQQLRGTPLADLPVHITEFNSSYRPDNPIHDTAFNAAYLAPVLAEGGDLVDSFSYWTFSDMFEEEGVPTSLFHGGFGLLTHRQIKKPTFHLYAFMARMAHQVLARGADHLVTTDDTGRVTVLAWAPVDHTAADSRRSGTRSSSPSRSARRRRPPPSSCAPPWTRSTATPGRPGGEMGRPASPLPRQLDMLREAAEPGRSHRSLPVVGGRVDTRPHPGPARGDPARDHRGDRRDAALAGRHPPAGP